MRSLLRRRSLHVLVMLLGLAYPFIVYAGLSVLSPAAIVPALLVFLAARLLLGRREGMPRGFADASLLAGVGALALAALSPVMGLKFYPIFLSLGLAGLFAHSLARPPTIIERIARITRPDLPSAALPYLRKVTIAWLVFFLLNASISAATALSGSLKLWTLYNGFISYILMGTLFAVEFVIRCWVRRAAGDAA